MSGIKPYRRGILRSFLSNYGSVNSNKLKTSAKNIFFEFVTVAKRGGRKTQGCRENGKTIYLSNFWEKNFLSECIWKMHHALFIFSTTCVIWWCHVYDKINDAEIINIRAFNRWRRHNTHSVHFAAKNLFLLFHFPSYVCIVYSICSQLSTSKTFI